MLPVGVGTDIVYLPRVRAIIERWGGLRFATRILSQKEIVENRSLVNSWAFLASRYQHSVNEFLNSCYHHFRFASKEAVFKALSGERRLLWREFAINRRSPLGSPTVCLPADLEDKYKVFLSVSHDGDYVFASALAINRVKDLDVI